MPSGRLAIAAAPRGGDDLRGELQALKCQGVEHVVSLLMPEEERERELGEEAVVCRACGLGFTAMPIEDRGVPQSERRFRETVEALVRRVREWEAVVIHCRAGIGRSAMVAACLAGHMGMASSAAFKVITRVRGCPVPDTDGQREWVERYGREVMG